MSPRCSPPRNAGATHHQPGDGHRHQHRNLADPSTAPPVRLLPVRPGAGGRPHLLRHARRRRRDRARGARDGRIAVQVIGGGQPVGLCGSGVLDALAALRAGGHRRRARPHRRRAPGRAKSTASAPRMLAPGVRFTQDDVRAVQLAKAAIRTGIELLLRDRGLGEDEIGRFVIAGAFGAFIDVQQRHRHRPLPRLPRERFVQVGNAAGVGVRLMLASQAARARRASWPGCRYIELLHAFRFPENLLHHIGFAARLRGEPRDTSNGFPSHHRRAHQSRLQEHPGAVRQRRPARASRRWR